MARVCKILKINWLGYSLFLIFFFFSSFKACEATCSPPNVVLPRYFNQWKCEISKSNIPEDKVWIRDCIEEYCCDPISAIGAYFTNFAGCTKISPQPICFNERVDALCNPWQRCIGVEFWTEYIKPRCEVDCARFTYWVQEHKSELEIDKKEIAFFDGRGRVGEDEKGNLVPVNLPVKFRWIAKVPNVAGFGLSCGPQNFFVDVSEVKRHLPLTKAFSEIVPLREYQYGGGKEGKLYDEVNFEYRSMVEEVAFKDPDLKGVCEEDPQNTKKERDRYKLKEKWLAAFDNENKIGELADFLVHFTGDESLRANSGSYVSVVSEPPPPNILSQLSSTSTIPWYSKPFSKQTSAERNYEKLRRALWGRLTNREFNYTLYHIDVLQRRKQIEYFIYFKECEETTDPASKIGKTLQKLSEKYCGKYNGRDPSLTVQNLLDDLRKAETKVAFVYSPSQDKEVGPCKIKNNVNAGNSPRSHNFSIALSAEMGPFNYCASGPIGWKTLLVNNTPEPIGFLVFRIYDPGYWNTGQTTIDLPTSTNQDFETSLSNFSQKIFWEFSTSSTSSPSFFRAIIERWVDPDWNGPDFLDVAKTHMRVNEKNIVVGTHLPLGGIDFIDFQYCTQGLSTINLGIQIRGQYRGEILLTNYYQDGDHERAFILDPEGEPLPKQDPKTGPSEFWLEVKNTAYSEHEARKCVELKEPPPTLLKETVFYTWPFIARSGEVDPAVGFYYVPLSAELKVHGDIFSWLGRHPKNRKHEYGWAEMASQAEEHAMWDTAFNYAVAYSRPFGSPPITYPVPAEYEINLCHPAQYPSRLRWTLIPRGSINDLKSFLSRFGTTTEDLLNVLEDKEVKEKCIKKKYLDQWAYLPEHPWEWSGRYLRYVYSGYKEEEVEECVKALTKAIQREIDKKCPPNQQWINVQTTPFRVPASKIQLEIDWRNDAYYVGSGRIIDLPEPHTLWFFDLKNSYFPAWPRVNVVQFRYADLQEYTGKEKESPRSVGPWGQKWHFRMATGYYKREEIPRSDGKFEIRYNLFSLNDLKKEIKLDPLFGNKPNLLEAKSENPPFIINRLQTLNVPELGRTISNKIMVKESVSVFGGFGEWFRVAVPIPRFMSQIRYRPTEAYLTQQRCAMQDFNFWQAWSILAAFWRNPQLLGRSSTDVDHVLKRTINIWFTHGPSSFPAGINAIDLEKIREVALTNELYFYLLPCQDEWGKPGNCYGWVGFKWVDGKLKLTYERWMDGIFKFAITGFPPGRLLPGTENYPGSNPNPQNLPPVKIPNKFIWGSVRGGARYLVEMAKGLIEPSNEKNDPGFNISLRREIRLFSPPAKNEMFINVFEEEGPYSWTVRTCADYCDELQEHQTPRDSYVLWCGKTADPHYFYGCFLTPPEKPQNPTLGQTFLPNETINFSWDPIECGDYPIYYQLRVIYSLRDHRENRNTCVPQTEVLNVFVKDPQYSTSTLECLGTYHWAIRACVAQEPDLDPPSLACTEWTTGDWSKFWYFNILSERAPHGGGTFRLTFCRQCETLLPQNCRDASPHTSCGLRELVQLIFNLLNCLLWCVSLVLLIILIGATGVILIVFASEIDLLDRVKTAWKGYGIGLIIMFFAWTFLNFIFELLNWQRQTFGDWWNPFP